MRKPKENHQFNEPALTADLTAIEHQLSRLVAAPAAINRDRLMFEAGLAAGQGANGLSSGNVRNLRLWQAAAGTMTAATIMVAGWLLLRTEAQPDSVVEVQPQTASGPLPVEKVATVKAIQPATKLKLTTPPVASGYLRLRHVALTEGVGALAAEPLFTTGVESNGSSPQPTSPVSVRELLDELLPSEPRQSRS